MDDKLSHGFHYAFIKVAQANIQNICHGFKSWASGSKHGKKMHCV
jgi:hypothetical protein